MYLDKTLVYLALVVSDSKEKMFTLGLGNLNLFQGFTTKSCQKHD